MSKELVLVSGATGFVASHIVVKLVEDGYRVRATSRSSEKAQALEKINPILSGKIEWFTVEDGTVHGAYDEAIKGVDIVCHVAGPYTFNSENLEQDILLPQLDGTKVMLNAADNESSVKHFVLTSSFGAIFDVSTLRPGYVYNEKDWNPATLEEAKNSNFPPFVYCASKALSERLVWDDPKRKYTVTCLQPGNIYGPVIHPVRSIKELNFSNAAYLQPLICGDENDYIPQSQIPVHNVTDVRDIAEFHLLAIKDPRLVNKRCMLLARYVTSTEWVRVLRKLFADKPEILARIPSKEGKDNMVDFFTVDNSLSKEILGRDYISLEKTAEDTSYSIWELEKGGNYRW